MKKNNLLVGLLSVFCVFSTSLFAETSELGSKKSLCLAEVNNNSDQAQQELEHWSGINRRQSQAEYEKQISEIEASQGVFDNAMVSELIGLGFLYQEQLDHAQAANAFQRALHIIRVNDGLYSTRQLPVIDLLIESNSMAQDWKQVADSYDMMQWLYRRNYADDDPRQLNAVKRLRRWHMESYNKDTGRSLEKLFTSAETLYKQGLKIMLACTEGNEREALCLWHKSCCADAVPENGICPLDRD